MKIFITGIGGFVGSNIAIALHHQGHRVGGCDTFQFGSSKNLLVGPLGVHYKNFADMKEEVLEEYDILVMSHCANIIYAMTHEAETYKINGLQTMQGIEKFSGKIIYLSTASVYNQANEIPTPETSPLHCVNAYDHSKLMIELYLKERRNFTTLRLSNVYGDNQRPESPYAGVVGRFIDQVIKGEPINIHGTGEQTRDYTFVTDVVRAVMCAINEDPCETEINIASGVETSCIELAKEIFRQAGVEVAINMVPNRKIDTIDRRCLDIKKADDLLNWQPNVFLPEGIARTIEWMKHRVV